MRRAADQHQPLRFWPAPRRPRRRWLGWLWLVLLLAAWAAFEWREANRQPPVRETVDRRFALCGAAAGAPACVVDGDTFRLGRRRIRIDGIDAPELAGACDAERRLAELSRERLRALLGAGPFVMTARRQGATDQYGRELRRLERRGQSLGDLLVGEGLARDYRGAKQRWC